MIPTGHLRCLRFCPGYQGDSMADQDASSSVCVVNKVLINTGYYCQVWDSLDNSVGKESTCNAGDPSSIPGLERSAGEGISYPLQYSSCPHGFLLHFLRSWFRCPFLCKNSLITLLLAPCSALLFSTVHFSI